MIYVYKATLSEFVIQTSEFHRFRDKPSRAHLFDITANPAIIPTPLRETAAVLD